MINPLVLYFTVEAVTVSQSCSELRFNGFQHKWVLDTRLWIMILLLEVQDRFEKVNIVYLFTNRNFKFHFSVVAFLILLAV